MGKKGGRKRIIRIVAAALIPAYLAVFVLFVLPVFAKEEAGEEGAPLVLSLWHVDVFEGGTGSRGEYLRARAAEFEKTRQNLFILVRSMTISQLETALEEGQKPDLISYAPGLAHRLLPELEAFSGTVQAYDNLLDSGTAEGLLMGVPWCAGGYTVTGINAYIDPAADFTALLASSSRARKSGTMPSFSCGFAAYNNPLLAVWCANDGIRLDENAYVHRPLSQQEAYVRFIGKSESVLYLGTQREFARISAREDAADFTVKALAGYTDLVCYISLFKGNAGRAEGTAFISYLLTEQAQLKLSGIGMLSAAFTGLYPREEQKPMSDLESALRDSAVPNAFTDPAIIAQQRDNAFAALNGDGDAARRIDSFLPKDMDTGLFA